MNLNKTRDEILRPRREGHQWTLAFKQRCARALHHARVSRDEFMTAHGMSVEQLNALIAKHGPQSGEAA